MGRVRRDAVILAVLVAVFLGVYSGWFAGLLGPQSLSPQVLAPAGSVFRLGGNAHAVTLMFGYDAWTSHLTGSWRSDSPAWAYVCPAGEHCNHLLPRLFAGFCGMTFNVTFPPGRYDFTFVPWNGASANVTITAGLAVTYSMAAPPERPTFEAPGNFAASCNNTA